MIKRIKGQGGLGTMIGVAGAIVIAMIGGWVTQNNINDGKIDVIRIETQTKIESVQKDLTVIKINTALICQKLNIKCRE